MDITIRNVWTDNLYNDKNISNEIFLSKEFFGGVDIAIDVKVKVICESGTDSIINQYIIFSKVYDEQRTK